MRRACDIFMSFLRQFTTMLRDTVVNVRTRRCNSSSLLLHGRAGSIKCQIMRNFAHCSVRGAHATFKNEASP